MFLKGDDAVGMGDEEGRVDTPWLTGDQAQGEHRHQVPVLGTFPGRWLMLGLMAVLDLELVAWLGARYHRVGSSPSCPGDLAGSGECPLLVAGTRERAGGTGGGCMMCCPCISPRTAPNLFVERGAEVEMPSLGGGCCALLMVPVPILCRSGAAAPSSSSSYGKHPQILQMASGQELLLGQAIHSLSNTALLPPENTWRSRLLPWRGLNWDN